MNYRWAPVATLFAATGLALLLASCAKESPVNPWHPDLAGDINVVVEPDYLEPGWTLTGPDGFSRNGIGSQTLNEVPAGNYSLDWSSLPGWQAPNSDSRTLEINGAVAFSGSYVLLTSGFATITVDPSSVAAPWTLVGPHGFSTEGVGTGNLSGLPLGTYTLTWGLVAGWTSPD